MKPLTVKELIEKLQKCDPEREVYFNYDELFEPCTRILDAMKLPDESYNLTDEELQECGFQKIIVIDSEPS